MLPTVVEPLRAEWEAVKTAALVHAQKDELAKARAETGHAKLMKRVRATFTEAEEAMFRRSLRGQADSGPPPISVPPATRPSTSLIPTKQGPAR